MAKTKRQLEKSSNSGSKATPVVERNDDRLPAGWTEGRLNAFITAVLRAGHQRWPFKYEIKNAAKLGKKVNPATNRVAEFYHCAGCGGEFTNKDVEVDHIIPVVDQSVGFVSWDLYISRLFAPRSNYQVLCTTCHKAKSKKEKQQCK